MTNLWNTVILSAQNCGSTCATLVGALNVYSCLFMNRVHHRSDALKSVIWSVSATRKASSLIRARLTHKPFSRRSSIYVHICTSISGHFPGFRAFVMHAALGAASCLFQSLKLDSLLILSCLAASRLPTWLARVIACSLNLLL